MHSLHFTPEVSPFMNFFISYNHAAETKTPWEQDFTGTTQTTVTLHLSTKIHISKSLHFINISSYLLCFSFVTVNKVVTRRSQHSQQRHDPHRKCFLCLMTLIFDPKINEFSGPLEYFDVTFGDLSWDIMRKNKQTNKHINATKNSTHATVSVWVIAGK